MSTLHTYKTHLINTYCHDLHSKKKKKKKRKLQEMKLILLVKPLCFCLAISFLYHCDGHMKKHQFLNVIFKIVLYNIYILITTSLDQLTLNDPGGTTVVIDPLSQTGVFLL